jgi:large subunit ribosomal protein L17
MRHNIDGRKFGRNTSHRRALFRNLANSVILQEQVRTTVPKAREVRRVVERLITLAKRGAAAPSSRRLAFDRTRDEAVVAKLFALADRYKSRANGYTRVLRLSDTRRGDAAEMAVLELVDRPALNRKKKSTAKPAEEGSETEADSSKAKAADPLKGFKKMFGRKKDGSAAPGQTSNRVEKKSGSRGSRSSGNS